MDHLKEQLKKHYDKTAPSEAFLQKLHALEAPKPAPVPIPMRRKRLLTPIAAMLIAAVAILSGGKYLMDMVPPTAVPPIETVPVESAVESSADAYDDVAPTTAAPDAPEMFYSEDPAPEETAPEKTAPQPGSADETAPQTPMTPESTDPVPPSDEPTDPAPPEDTPDPKPPIEVEGSADDPTPPPDDDVPPHDPGDDDPPANPGEDDPANPPDDPPDNPLDKPLGPEVLGPAGEPDEPINPGPPPEIYGFYTKSNGQHAVCVINCDTGESKTLILNTTDSPNSYRGYHNAFGYTLEVSVQSASSAPTGPGTAELEQTIPHSSNYKVTVKVIGIA